MEKLKDFRATELGLIPTDWNLNLVGEVAEINPQNLRGTTDGDTEISYIDIESVNEGRISEYKKVLFRDAPSRARRIVKRNDVLISTVRPYLKAFAMIRDDVHNLVCSTGFSVVRCKEDLYPSFLYHYVFSDIFMNRILNKMVGSNYPAVNASDIKNTLIILPPIKEQKKIAEILSTVDVQIENVDQLIEKTKELKKGLMQRLLTKGIGHTKFKQTELGEIPEEWDMKTLESVLDVRDGTHDSPSYLESGVPFITSKNLKNGKLDFSNVSYISGEDHEKFKHRSQVSKGDILFGMIGTVGNPVIVDVDFEFSIKNVALIKFHGSAINNKFILEFLNSSITVKQFKKMSNGGVQKFISLGMIRKSKVLVPPLHEQERIATIFSTIDEQIETYEQEKEKYIELKKGLMQQLLTGKVRVKV